MVRTVAIVRDGSATVARSLAAAPDEAAVAEGVTESFRFLLRKQTLVQRVVIAPDTFAIRLYDDTGRAVPKDRLSEGEKQIFAVSVLWGLSRAAARPLPAIIDTPMARMDAKHRDKLVERYFRTPATPGESFQASRPSSKNGSEPPFVAGRPNDLSRALHPVWNRSSQNGLTLELTGAIMKCNRF